MSRILTGSKAQVRINGNIVAFASNISVDYDYALANVDILGQLETGDLAETGHTARATCDHFMLVDKSFSSTAVELGFENAVLASMRDQAYFDIEIFDTTNANEIRMKLKDCKFASGSGRMAARDLWTGTWSFTSRKVEHPSARASA